MSIEMIIKVFVTSRWSQKLFLLPKYNSKLDESSRSLVRQIVCTWRQHFKPATNIYRVKANL